MTRCQQEERERTYKMLMLISPTLQNLEKDEEQDNKKNDAGCGVHHRRTLVGANYCTYPLQ